MRLYTVILCDDLLEYPMLDGRVYLTKYDAQRRADRMTYDDELCRHWANVKPVECMWDTDAKGPFDDYKSDWMRFIDYATSIKRERDSARAENAKLRELVRNMWLYDYAGKFSSKREDMEHVAMVYQRMRDLGIEVDE